MKDQTVRKLDIRVQKTFSRLSETFFEMMREKPYDGITVLGICDRAGVHRATFYKHFIDKQDFVNFCFEKRLESLELDCDGIIIGNTEKARLEYIELCGKIVDFVYDNRSIIADLNSNTTSSAFTVALTGSIADAIEKRLNRDKNAGAKFLSPVPMLAHYYAGAIVEILEWWSVDGTEYTKDDIKKFVALRFTEAQYSYSHAEAVFGE